MYQKPQLFYGRKKETNLPTITIDNLTVRYRNSKTTETALDGLCLTFKPGAFNVVIGPSGSGKTTLLKTVAGQLEYDGVITFDGKNVRNLSEQDRNLAFVTQQNVLYPRFTVFDNIAFPLKANRQPPAVIIEKVRDVAEKLDITACLTRKPRHLSGGQQQRVAIAKALVKNSDICLLDEPFSDLDEKTRTYVRRLLKSTLESMGSTAIYVTHDFKEALLLADYLIVLDKGKLVTEGDATTVYNSKIPLIQELKKVECLD